jgi:hypothetical protein
VAVNRAPPAGDGGMVNAAPSAASAGESRRRGRGGRGMPQGQQQHAGGAAKSRAPAAGAQ